MGYKKIAEKRAEFQQKEELYRNFRKSLYEISDTMTALQKAQETRMTLMNRVTNMNTLGVKEFEDYRKNLVDVLAKGENFRPLPMGLIEKVVDNSKKEVEEMVRVYAEKLAASCPKDLKPGMTFYDQSLKRFYEIKSGPSQAQNANLKGDAAVLFKVVFYAEGGKPGPETSLPLADLKKMKYLNT